MAKVVRKWQWIEEADKMLPLMGIMRLKLDLLALERLTDNQPPPQRQLMEKRKSVAYLIGYTSGLGFGLVLWGQGKMLSESGEFPPLYQGRSSNFQEGDNLHLYGLQQRGRV